MQNKLLKGTIILTSAGLLTRIIGFGYRIFLSYFLGTAWLGVYQLIFPIYGIAFTIYGAGLQTALSQSVSSCCGSNWEQVGLPRKMIRCAVTASLLIALLFSITVFLGAGPLSILMNTPQLKEPLHVLAFAFPVCGVSAVLNGVFFGTQNAKVPAKTQLVEQCIRVLFVVSMAFSLSPNEKTACVYAVWGVVMGEFISCIYHLWQYKKLIHKTKNYTAYPARFNRHVLTMAIPLSATHGIVAVLNTIESVLIPWALVMYGFSRNASLSQYGILSGMVLPFLLFPGTITNSMAVMLLPEVASAQGEHKINKIRLLVERTIVATMQLGLLATLTFILFGKNIGSLVFGNATAGNYLILLSVLCPFIYTSTTLTSILNGLGKATTTLRNTVAGVSIRILILLALVPRYGLFPYMAGLVFSQMLITILNGRKLYAICHYKLDIVHDFIKPAALLYLLGYGCLNIVDRYVPKMQGKWGALSNMLVLPILLAVALLYGTKTWQRWKKDGMSS